MRKDATKASAVLAVSKAQDEDVGRVVGEVLQHGVDVLPGRVDRRAFRKAGDVHRLLVPVVWVRGSGRRGQSRAGSG